MRRPSNGSSPRAWGKGGRGGDGTAEARIIPTSVGKSARTGTRRARRSDHPHERGEKRPLSGLLLSRHGSSPRAWGKVCGREGISLMLRIIPTSVGKSTTPPSARSERPDHPHERGEKSSRYSHAAAERGSSPRAWGKEPSADPRDVQARIIPTSVGKRRPVCLKTPMMADHPHERGEKRILIPASPPQPGSSPRAWGKAGLSSDTRGRCRIIPTSVGKRTEAASPPTPWPDHPHERGEKRGGVRRPHPVAGSSPRAWGKE